MATTFVNMENSISVETTLKSTKTCRLCLSSEEVVVPLFQFEEIDACAVTLAMQVSICTAVNVSKYDSFPQNICSKCYTFVRQWFTFRQKCQQSDSMLKKRGLGLHLNDVAVRTEPLENVDVSLQDSENESSADKIILNLDGHANEVEIKRKAIMRIKCKFCPDSFSSPKDLKSHVLLVHRGKSRQPSSRMKVTNGGRRASTKRRVKSSYEMKCCGRVFFNKSLFQHHTWKTHPGEKPYFCDICGKKDFISEETLKRHKMLHTRRYACEICGRTFTCHAILRIHERDKHENDRPFVCDVCGKAFVTELLLSYHQRFHTGEKKYVCEECGVAVVTSSSLAKHRRIHSKVKPHVCGICGKGFIVRGRLIEHIRIHTGERPFVCEICSKAFTMQDKLKRHMRSHSDQKPFSCEICGNAYATNHSLSVHRKSHTLRHQ